MSSKPLSREHFSPRDFTRLLVIKAVHRIAFRNAVIPTSLIVTRKQLRVIISTRDRNDGSAMTLQAGWTFPREGLTTDDQAISWITACVRETWVHELHESLFVDAVRRNDLHEANTPNTRPPPPDLVDPWWQWKRT